MTGQEEKRPKDRNRMRREEQRAAALRANLKRRKEQAAAADRTNGQTTPRDTKDAHNTKDE